MIRVIQDDKVANIASVDERQEYQTDNQDNDILGSVDDMAKSVTSVVDQTPTRKLRKTQGSHKDRIIDTIPKVRVKNEFNARLTKEDKMRKTQIHNKILYAEILISINSMDGHLCTLR